MTAPDANAPPEWHLRPHVDAAHCDRAAQGLRRMAQSRVRSLAARHDRIDWLKHLQRGGRKMAPAFGAVVVLAALVASAVAWADPSVRAVDATLAALEAPRLIPIFPKPGAVTPAMIVLTADDGAMTAALRAPGWTIAEIDTVSGEPRAAEAQ